jgi:hypothetical protein
LRMDTGPNSSHSSTETLSLSLTAS